MARTKFFPVFALLLSALPTVFLASQPSFPDWLDYSPSPGQFRLRQAPPLNPWPESKEKPSWGIYLWEFGDGHFSFEEEPVHQYVKKGSYEVRLHLTPFYATNDPVSLKARIEAPGKASRTPIYNLAGKKALLESNSSNYIVPEQAFQLVTHYEAPTGFSGKQGGYLFVFYNKKQEISLLYNAFELAGERTHYQEKAISDKEALPTIINHLKGERQTAALDLANQYKGKLAYRIENMGPGEQRRLFLSLAASRHLKSQQDKNRELTVAMLWVPDAGNFSKEAYTHEHKMQILAVYDPNRIRVNPRIAYFRKGYPKTLYYRVEFQNKEEGRVRDVTLVAPVDKSLQLNTARIIAMDPELDNCYGNYAGKDTSCIRLETAEGLFQDTVRIFLRNVGLEGKKSKGFFQNKQSTKGFVEFKIKTAEEKTGANRVRAHIHFDEVEPVETRNAKTKWRRRAAYLRPAFPFGPAIPGFDNDASGLGGRIHLAMGIQDAPVTTGLAYGAELGYSGFRFFRQAATPLENDPQLPPGALLVTEERSRLSYLEPRAWGGYQLNGWLRGYAGAGLSIPASGRVDVQSSIRNPNNDFIILQEDGGSRFGLFQSKEPLSIFESESELRNSVGFTWQFGFEAGLLDVFTLGINQELRFFPTFYHNECARIFSWQAYMRIQLFPVGGKF